MGLSSSQARLLTLTARMHQIEYKAAKLEAMKLQMANESRQVYEDYLDALDKTKVQVKVLTTNGATTYTDIKNYANDFLGNGYAVDFRGVVYDGKTSEEKYDEANNIFASDATIITVTTANQATYPNFKVGDKIAKKPDDTFGAVVGDSIAVKTLDWNQLCKDAFKAESGDNLDVETVLTNLINSGLVTIVQGERTPTGWDFRKEYSEDFVDWESSISTNTGLQEVTDEIELRKAEAKYEADMKRIDVKDRRFDTELAAIESERNAIKQEMETLKTVSKDNVERTFKLFS
jgi:hypothetical protein